jgi:pimeloyl-ACP methyl ester carboxylesterase
MKKKNLVDDLASRLGGAFDGAVLSALSSRFAQRRSPEKAVRAPESVDRRALLAEAIAFYQRDDILSGEAFFARPARIVRMHSERRGGLSSGETVDLKWESGYQPAWPLVREDYLRYEPNRHAYARLYRHAGTARATIVCLHGYRGGPFFIEERAFPVKWLYSLGLDVVLFQLPFHGKRGGSSAPVWPSVNVGRTNEGFAHAIHDLRALFAWIGEQSGVRPVIVCGMSLGGYTTSLLATVEPLALAAPMIPVASFPDLLWDHGEGRPERARAEREGITLDMVRLAMACHTPLERKPLTPPERVLVMSALGDRIAPPEHAARLARHFDCEELRFTGGHILQLGRGSAFRALARRMAKLDLLPPR